VYYGAESNRTGSIDMGPDGARFNGAVLNGAESNRLGSGELSVYIAGLM
jgi:hypothetical protein